MFVDSTWQSPFVAMNIEYKDSVYSIVPREGDMYLFLNDGVANKKYRYELFPILLEQTLGIDSITFCSLKEMDCMVTPQPYIDSIYKGKVENLISLLLMRKVYFLLVCHIQKKNIWFICYFIMEFILIQIAKLEFCIS